MLGTVLDVLSTKKGEKVLDVTLGLGGHSVEFLKAIGSSGKLIGLDADEKNLEEARKNLSAISMNFELHHSNFSRLSELELPQVDILFADLGLSSPHLDDPGRGFTFREDTPLDLRFDQSRGITGANLIKQSSEQDLFLIFKKYGELEQARKLAKAIKATHIDTTGDLRACTEAVCGHRAVQALPQVFQALRIAVNDEIGALESLLKYGPTLLKPGGRMGIITFHSLEDRPVKQKFRELSTSEKDEVTGAVSKEADFELLTKKPLLPSEEELEENSRARSAKFRAIRKNS